MLVKMKKRSQASDVSAIIVILLATHVVNSWALYLPLLAPPGIGERGMGTTLNILQKYPDLECEPERPADRPVLSVEAGINRRILPKCPPGNSKPVIAKVAQNITLKAGQTITIEVAYGGFPEPSIEYFKDGSKVYPSDRIKLLKKLEITNASRAADKGVYTAIVTNSEGSDKLAVWVEVLDRPSPPIGPIDTSDITQNTVHLNWTQPKDSGGVVISRYVVEKWSPDNQTWTFVLNTTKTGKVIGNLVPASRYKFRVSAANKYGVSDPIESSPFVAMGRPSPARSAKFTPNRNSVEVWWETPKRDNGSPITGYVVERRQLPDGAWKLFDTTLGETRLTKDTNDGNNEYQYRVLAVNDAGLSDPSKLAELQVPQIAAFIDKSSLHNITANVSDKVWFEVSVGGQPEPEFQWRHNGRAIYEQMDKINITATDNRTALFIPVVDTSHRGNYTVVVNNSVGADEATVQLDVQQPSAGIRAFVDNSSLNDVYVHVGDNATFTAVFGGTPEVTFDWKHNGSPIADQSIRVSSDGNKSTLFIGSVRESDAGNYTLSVTNKAGTEEVSASLFLLPLVPPANGPIVVVNSTGDSIRIAWSPSNDSSPVEYLVLRQNQTSGEYEMVGLTADTQINVDDLGGKNETRVRVLVVSPNGVSAPLEANIATPSPKLLPPEAPLLVKTSNDSISLKWNPPNNTSAQPVTYKVEKFNPDSNSWEPVGNTTANQVSISNLKPNTAYKFRIKTIDSFNESEPLVSPYITTDMSRPETPSGPLLVTDISGNQATLSWNASKPDDGRPVNEYLVEKQQQNQTDWQPIGTTRQTKSRVSNLEPTKSYRFRVKAINDGGQSEPLVSDLIRVGPTLPEQPEGPLTASDVRADGLTLVWRPPKNDGGDSVWYRVDKLDENNTWKTVGESPVTKILLTNLTSGLPVKYRVVAVNRVGPSLPLTGEDAFTARSAPDAPSKPTVTAFDATGADLSWTAPNDNGAKVTHYLIEVMDKSGENGVNAPKRRKRETAESPQSIANPINTGSDQTKFKVKPLIAGKSYQFRVRAVNSVGISLPSLWSDAITLPSKGIEPKIEAIPNSYIVKEGQPISLTIAVTGQPTPQINIRKLDSGVALTSNVSLGKVTLSSPQITASHAGKYSISASNAIGVDERVFDIIVTKQSTVPSVPVGPLVVEAITHNSLVLRWDAPCADGGEPVTEYSVEKLDYSNSDSNEWQLIGRTADRQVKLTRLAPHMKYKFRVSAINLIGHSLQLETSTWIELPPERVSPLIDRSKVKDMEVRVGDDFNIVIEVSAHPVPHFSWLVNQTQLTSQVCDRYHIDGGVLSIKRAQRSDSGLYEAIAENAAGSDAVSIRLQVIDIPSCPRGVLNASQVHANQVLLKWLASADTGSHSAQYLVEARESTLNEWRAVGKTPATEYVIDLDEGLSYLFRVYAINEVGKSQALESIQPFLVLYTPTTTSGDGIDIHIHLNDDDGDDLRDLLFMNKMPKPVEEHEN